MADSLAMTSRTATLKDPRRQLLEQFARQYGGARERSRFVLSVTPGESDRHFSVTTLGGFNARAGRELIISAPRTPNGGLIAVTKGTVLRCSWFNASTAFKFAGVITKVLFEPQPLLYLRLAEQTWFRPVRTVPRALVNLPAVARMPELVSVLLVDISVTGARMAALQDTGLHVGQVLQLSLQPKLDIDISTTLTLSCTVMSDAEPVLDHPQFVFHGLKFNDMTERDLLVLHAYVQQALSVEMDMLAPILLSARDLKEIKEA